MEINETELMEIMATSIANAVKPLHEEVATLKAQLNGSTEKPKEENKDMLPVHDFKAMRERLQKRGKIKN